MQKLAIKRLSVFSVFKLLFIGLIIPLFLFGLVCGIFAYAGSNTVAINGTPVYGMSGFLGGVALGVVLPLILSILFTILISIGLWVHSWFRTMVISYKPSNIDD